MNLIFQSVAKKFLASFLKGLIAALITSLTAFAAAPIQSDDKFVIYVMTFIVAAVHAAISALKRWATFDFSKLPK